MNLFDFHNLPDSGEEDHISLTKGKKWRVDKIVSNGYGSEPGFWYEQKEAEFVAVLKGWGEIEFADGSVCKLSPGQWLYLPSLQRHRIKDTSKTPPCIWLCFYVED